MQRAGQELLRFLPRSSRAALAVWRHPPVRYGLSVIPFAVPVMRKLPLTVLAVERNST